MKNNKITVTVFCSFQNGAHVEIVHLEKSRLYD